MFFGDGAYLNVESHWHHRSSQAQRDKRHSAQGRAELIDYAQLKDGGF
jgi:hypothetical protein